MRALPVLALGALFLACGDGEPGPDIYEATLSGSSEVPPNISEASGSVVLTDRGGRIDYRIDVQNLDLPTAAHIHAGAEGANGGVIVPLFSTNAPVASFSGRLVTDSFVEADIGTLAAMSMDTLRAMMRTGRAYVNVHTTALPAGEIRGQIERR